MARTQPDLAAIDVIAPNFKRRHSGVTSTVIRLVPIQARDIAITACAPDLPPDVPNVPWTQLVTMSRKGPSGARVWHARRNVEMLAGIALKYLLGKRLKLLFTSAAQRHHTGFTRWLIRQQDALIATSTRSASYLERPAQVILHGVDCDTFQPAQDKTALRAELGLPTTGPLIGCFGRIRPQKGNDLFITAMIKALQTHQDAHALMMGRATEAHAAFLQDLKAQVAAAHLTDRIHFRDEVPIADLAAHFQALDLYVAPQRWEGFGLTPLEAMACGAPVIATRVGAFEDLILEGETGHLLDPGSAETIAQTTISMLDNRARLASMGQRARAHMEARFRIEGEARAIIAVYRDLLAA